MTTHYHAGWNMVGYLPEMDSSYPFEDWDRAKRSMIDDLLREADSEADNLDGVPNPDYAEIMDSTAQDLNLSNGPTWDAFIGHMHYWIVACVEEECLEEEYAR